MAQNYVVMIIRIVFVALFARCCDGSLCYGCHGTGQAGHSGLAEGVNTSRPPPAETTMTVHTSTTRPTLPPGSFMCWSCSMSGAGRDTTCFDDPSRVPTANKVRCTPPRQCNAKVYLGSRQGIDSFQRGCEPPQPPVNGCVADHYGTTCQTFCTGDYCNTGNGVPPGTRPPSEKPITTRRPTPPPDSFMCWSCSMSGADMNTTCFDDPSRVTTANKVMCRPPLQCYAKLEWSSRQNHIISFARGCTPLQAPNNRCVTDHYGTTCQNFCTGDYCNSGNGVPPGTKPPWEKVSDMHFKTVCENNPTGSEMFINCPWPTKIHVEFAAYGRLDACTCGSQLASNTQCYARGSME